MVETEDIRILDLLGDVDRRAAMIADVRRGLLERRKELPPKYFYDERGSQLFERICELPEYYQTRTEAAILESNADRLIQGIGARSLIEFGSGSSSKTRSLLSAMQRNGTLEEYVP